MPRMECSGAPILIQRSEWQPASTWDPVTGKVFYLDEIHIPSHLHGSPRTTTTTEQALAETAVSSIGKGTPIPQNKENRADTVREFWASVTKNNHHGFQEQQTRKFPRKPLPVQEVVTRNLDVYKSVAASYRPHMLFTGQHSAEKSISSSDNSTPISQNIGNGADPMADFWASITENNPRQGSPTTTALNWRTRLDRRVTMQ